MWQNPNGQLEAPDTMFSSEVQQNQKTILTTKQMTGEREREIKGLWRVVDKSHLKWQ